MIDANRKAAYEILLRIENEGAYSSEEILMKESDNQLLSSNFLRRLIYGVQEKKLYLDYILSNLVDKGVSSVDIKTLTLMREGLYQLIFMDGIPEYAAINSTVELAKKYAKGRDGFINAVLRSYLRNKDNIEFPDRENDFSEYLSVVHSVDKSIVENWMHEFGPKECERLLAAIDREEIIALRTNTIKNSRHEAMNKLRLLGIDPVESALSPRSILISGVGNVRLTDTDMYNEGKFSIQSQESTWIADLMDAKSGERILDVCAAPGGKTMAIAESMNNNGYLLAWDIYDHRIKKIVEQSKRLGINIVNTECWDASKMREDLGESFDAVLIDAPCSGFGVMSRKPEIRYKKIKDLEKLPEIQLSILSTCSNYVKKGGRLIYSTCTINQKENNEVINKFINTNRKFTLAMERQLLPQDGYNGFYAAILKK